MCAANASFFASFFLAYGLWRALQPPRFHAWLSPLNLSVLVSIASAAQTTNPPPTTLGAMIDISNRIFGDYKDAGWFLKHMQSIEEKRFADFILYSLINKAFYQAQKTGLRQPDWTALHEICNSINASGTPASLWFMAIAFASGHVQVSGIHKNAIFDMKSLSVLSETATSTLRNAASRMTGAINYANEISRTMFLINAPLEFAAKVLMYDAGIIHKNELDRQLVANLNGFIHLPKSLIFKRNDLYSPYQKYLSLAEDIHQGLLRGQAEFFAAMHKVFEGRTYDALVILPLVITTEYSTRNHNLMKVIARFVDLPNEFSKGADDYSKAGRTIHWVNAIMQHKERFQDAWHALSSPSLFFTVLRLTSSARFENNSRDVKFLKTYLQTLDALFDLHEYIVPFPTLCHVYAFNIFETQIKLTNHDNIKDMIAKSPVYERVKRQTESIGDSLRTLRSIEPIAQAISQQPAGSKDKKDELLTKMLLLESMVDIALSGQNDSPSSLLAQITAL